MIIQHWRHLWRHAPRFHRHTFFWDIIRNDSFVIITAAEAGVGSQVPSRFIGEAKPIVVGNIAAHDGFVEFTMWYGPQNFYYLDIWTDITVFDRNDPSGAN